MFRKGIKMLNREQLIASLIKYGFTTPSNQPNIKVHRLLNPNPNEPNLYVKPLQNKSLENYYLLAIHTKYHLLPDEELSALGIYKNPIKELKSSFIGFQASPKPPQKEAFTFNFKDENALQQFLKILLKIDVIDDLVLSPEENALPVTEKNALMKLRIGQSKYRQDLLDHWKGCSVTGATCNELLIASHIKPWAIDEGARLDQYNGLLLTPNLDALFDKGFISFNEDGSIKLSSKLSKEDLDHLGLHSGMMLREGFDPKHRPYLAWHRSNLFKV